MMAEQAMPTSSMGDAAVSYARHGWCVFPLHSWTGERCTCGKECSSPAKHPRTRNGLHDATTDEATVRAWWDRWPEANIGVRTGAVSGVVVVDVDSYHGGDDGLAQLEATHGGLPRTMTASTGGGGRHLVFRHPGGHLEVRNRAGLAPGVDLRGDGGYVVAPPSNHASGGAYAWLRPLGDVAPAPAWLVEPAKSEEQPRAPLPPLPNAADNPWVRAAFEGEIEELSRATQGGRNHQLNRSAYNLGQLVPHALAESEVVDALTNVARAIGLSEDETAKTLASGLGDGKARPRAIPERIMHIVGGTRPPRVVGAPEGDAADAQGFIPFERITIDLRTPLEPPELLHPWLYAGKLTVLQSEPGVGKSWLAAWLSVQVMAAGYSVVYLDEEGGPDLIKERLNLLEADPEVVDRRFWYFGFEGRLWMPDDLVALGVLLAEVPEPHGLVVFDSLPDFLAAAELSEDSAKDVTSFVAKVCAPFRRLGMAQLLLDHLPKPSTDGKPKRGRYSRGSGAKLAKADATLLVETEREFDANNSGQLRLWKTKDRRGRLELPGIAKPGVEVAVTVAPDSVEFTVVEKPALATWDGPTECMTTVSDVLKAAAPTELTGQQVIDRMRALGHGFRITTVREALERLALEGRCSAVAGRRGARLYGVREEGNYASDALEGIESEEF